MFRQESFNGFQQTIAAALGRDRPLSMKREPLPPKPAPAKVEHAIKAVRKRFQRSRWLSSWSRRHGRRLLRMPLRSEWKRPRSRKILDQPESGPLLHSEQASSVEHLLSLSQEKAKATVVRLINGRVASVHDTRTVSPPLLVPRAGHTEHVLFETYSR